MSIAERGPSHGKQVQRRRVLGEARREPLPDRGERRTIDSKDDPIRQARIRLLSVELALSPDNEESMSPSEKASLEVERIWLKFKVGDISERKRLAEVDSILDNLSRKNPEVHKSLTKLNGDGMTTRLVEIRDRVIPPIKIGGFHTKRK